MRLVKIWTCKIRHFLIILFTAVTTTLTFYAFSREESVDIQSLISGTTKHLEQLKLRGSYPPVHYQQQDLQDVTKEKKFKVEDTLLFRLGFRRHGDNSSNFKQFQHGSSDEELSVKHPTNSTIPVVVVSAVTVKQLAEVPGFLNNVYTNILPPHVVVLWNLEKQHGDGIETEFSLSLRQLCNSTKCHVENFKFADFPTHVGDLQLSAYRPLIIQTMTGRGTCVLWLDIDRRLVPNAKTRLNEFVRMALHGGSHGIVGWSAGHPTSSLTHPKTFSYFQTGAENYYFHRMIDPAQLLICSTDFVHNKIMLPWIECTLTKDCIDPFGAQSSGCRFDKKPLYRYSGCHLYDSSALNVALGVAFPLHQPYISRAVVAQLAQQIPENETTSHATFR